MASTLWAGGAVGKAATSDGAGHTSLFLTLTYRPPQLQAKADMRTRVENLVAENTARDSWAQTVLAVATCFRAAILSTIPLLLAMIFVLDHTFSMVYATVTLFVGFVGLWCADSTVQTLKCAPEFVYTQDERIAIARSIASGDILAETMAEALAQSRHRMAIYNAVRWKALCAALVCVPQLGMTLAAIPMPYIAAGL